MKQSGRGIFGKVKKKKMLPVYLFIYFLLIENFNILYTSKKIMIYADNNRLYFTYSSFILLKLQLTQFFI